MRSTNGVAYAQITTVKATTANQYSIKDVQLPAEKGVYTVQLGTEATQHHYFVTVYSIDGSAISHRTEPRSKPGQHASPKHQWLNQWGVPTKSAGGEWYSMNGSFASDGLMDNFRFFFNGYFCKVVAVVVLERFILSKRL